jgi:ribosome-associated protein
MIRVNAQISIDEREIEESFVRASGPGGQNVNKLATAVQLRFDVRGSPSLSAETRARLERLAGTRLTRDGVLVIIAQRHRTQARNRADARERLIDLIRRAATLPIKRRATRPTKASRERRIEGKKRRAGIKLRRSRPAFD